MGSKQVPLHVTPVNVFQHPIKFSLINLQFQIMFSVVPKTSTRLLVIISM